MYYQDFLIRFYKFFYIPDSFFKPDIKEANIETFSQNINSCGLQILIVKRVGLIKSHPIARLFAHLMKIHPAGQGFHFRKAKK